MGKLITKKELILIIVVLSLAFLSLIFLRIGSKKGGEVTVYVDGKVETVLPLNEDANYEISTKKGKNLLCIENKEAFIKEADCPDGICVHHKKISLEGETIVCLPHKVVVEVTKGDETEYDAITQ